MEGRHGSHVSHDDVDLVEPHHRPIPLQSSACVLIADVAGPGASTAIWRPTSSTTLLELLHPLVDLVEGWDAAASGAPASPPLRSELIASGRSLRDTGVVR